MNGPRQFFMSYQSDAANFNGFGVMVSPATRDVITSIVAGARYGCVRK
jgi:hypothetical protein